MKHISSVLLLLFLCVPLCFAVSVLDAWRKFVSLAQPLDQNKYSTFPGDPPINITIYNTIEEDGYKLERINSLGTHTGTHLSAPCHFIEGRKCVDELDPSAFVFVAALLDFSANVSAAPQNAGFQLTWDDILRYERKVGRLIPEDALVILYTGFGNKFGTPAYANNPFPGFTADAVQQLFTHRKIKGLGSDTFGPDASTDENFEASYTAYDNGGITIENMARLDQLKGRNFGDIVVATPAKLKKGSGFQCNVLAFISYFNL